MNELEAYCYLVDSLKQDSLEHKGVKGMKWKNHVYKTYNKGKQSIKKLIKKIRKSLKNFADNWKVGKKELKKMEYAAVAKATKKYKNDFEKAMLKDNATFRKSAGPEYRKKFSFDNKKRHRLTEYPKSQVKKAKFDMAMQLRNAAIIVHDKSGKYSKADKRAARMLLNIKNQIDWLNKIKKKAGDRYE